MDIQGLYSGVQSLIQGDGSAPAEQVQLTKPGLVPDATKPAEPEKQLYEVLPEVDLASKDG